MLGSKSPARPRAMASLTTVGGLFSSLATSITTDRENHNLAEPVELAPRPSKKTKASPTAVPQFNVDAIPRPITLPEVADAPIVMDSLVDPADAAPVAATKKARRKSTLPAPPSAPIASENGVLTSNDLTPVPVSEPATAAIASEALGAPKSKRKSCGRKSVSAIAIATLEVRGEDEAPAPVVVPPLDAASADLSESAEPKRTRRRRSVLPTDTISVSPSGSGDAPVKQELAKQGKKRSSLGRVLTRPEELTAFAATAPADPGVDAPVVFVERPLSPSATTSWNWGVSTPDRLCVMSTEDVCGSPNMGSVPPSSKIDLTMPSAGTATCSLNINPIGANRTHGVC